MIVSILLSIDSEEARRLYRDNRDKMSVKDAEILDSLVSFYVGQTRKREKRIERLRKMHSGSGASMRREVVSELAKELGITAKEARNICEIHFKNNSKPNEDH